MEGRCQNYQKSKLSGEDFHNKSLDKKIVKIESSYPRMILTGLTELQEQLTNKVITGISRRGKYLIFEFDAPYRLISHLRMEGKYRLEKGGTQPLKHDHIFVSLASNQGSGEHPDQILVYADVRKFGTWELIGADALSTYFKQKKIGPEPTPMDFDESLFAEKIKSFGKKNKTLFT